MTQLILWGIMSYGLMNIMVYGSIFQGLRDFFKKWGENENAPFYYVGNFIHGILKCPMCFSTHGGFFLGLKLTAKEQLPEQRQLKIKQPLSRKC